MSSRQDEIERSLEQANKRQQHAVRQACEQPSSEDTSMGHGFWILIILILLQRVYHHWHRLLLAQVLAQSLSIGS